jgi:hypothetical protein
MRFGADQLGRTTAESRPRSCGHRELGKHPRAAPDRLILQVARMAMNRGCPWMTAVDRRLRARLGTADETNSAQAWRRWHRLGSVARGNEPVRTALQAFLALKRSHHALVVTVADLAYCPTAGRSVALGLRATRLP